MPTPTQLTASLVTKMSHGVNGGVASVTGVGQKWTIIGGSAPAIGDHITIDIFDGQTATQVKVGAGDGTGIVPSYCFVYNDKVYVLAGAETIFSSIGSAVSFNDPEGIGNGFVIMGNQFQTPEDLLAAAPFQGRMAFFSRNTTQIWQVAADPTAWAIQQVLQNIGTIAKDSVKPKGDLDILFLADTGVRSLKARQATLNAFVDDIGSPIDSLIRAKVVAYPTDAPNACAIVEPTTGQYWLFLKDSIYVLSYYPSSKVAAWSIFEPKDDLGITFTPTRFINYKGQVFARAGNSLYQYGGPTANGYDATVATWELPWFDMKKPGLMKTAMGINVAYTGAWTFDVGLDPVSGTLDTAVWSGSSNTYDLGIVPVPGRGSHFKAKGRTTGATAAIFSSLVFHYQEDEEV